MYNKTNQIYAHKWRTNEKKCVFGFGCVTHLFTIFWSLNKSRIKVGSSILNVNGKQYILPQPVIKNNAGIMVPLELFTEGTNSGLCIKDDLITIIPPETPDVELVTDEDKGLSKLLGLFDKAKLFVYIQMYQINNKTIIDKIIKTRNRGVKILVMLDENKENKDSNVLKKISDNKNCYVHLINKPGWLVYHKKIAIFDGQTVFTGSSNWTNAGLGNAGNDEQNFIIRSSLFGYEMKENFLCQWDPKRKKEQPKTTVPCGN